MTICSIIIAVMFASRYDRYQEVFGYVVLYIIALVMYFTYEIITTKRWKNLLRAIPALAIVAALNFGLYGAMAAIHASQLNYLPSASSVKSVYLVSDNFYGGYYGGWGVLSFSDYARMQNSSVELKEKEVISIVADSLADCVDTFKARPRDYYYIYNSPSKGDGEGYNFSTFKIKTARGEKYRSIFVPLSKWDTILKAIEDNEDYKKLWMTLPEEIANTVYVQTDAAHIDGKKAAEIYAKMKEELKTADFVEWYQKVNMASERDALRAQVGVQTRVGSKTYHVRIPIIQSLMPESYTLFCKALYEYQKGNVQIVKDILANNKDAKTALGVTLFRYDSETKQHIQYGSPYSYMSEESYQEVAQFLLDYIG